MASKFNCALVEEAYDIAGDGFAEAEFGSVEDLCGWNALVSVGESLVWIQEDSQGFVDLVMHGGDGGLRSGTDLVNAAWDEFVLNSIIAD